MHTSTEFLLALWTLAVVEGLRVTEVVVPPFLVIGQRARLRCHFALEGEVLYSLKWWKDGSQFYQFIPRNDPKMVVFSVAGVTVNVENSNLHEVELVDVQTSSSGQYRCEVVAEAPTFNTHVLSANMTIIGKGRGALSTSAQFYLLETVNFGTQHHPYRAPWHALP
ncbi:uncharacterized protein LOC119597885 [Penaeus monodon]|uniref:uncharacterized protein LOC119597885 n=1 Tax=Penaeus monodon TaxID=6687 RepID=UPI0018A74CE8|nr:uncharacterized protein LOC119597885 [Penaeus monodon]